MLNISKKLLDQIYTESERCYPDEACGLILGNVGDGRTAVEIVPCKNIQNDLHARDPVRFTREAKTAYSIDPKEYEKIQKDAEQKGLKLVSIFHSHPEHGVYFSDEDKGMAAPWGEPLFPDLSYVVVSVYDRKIKNCSEFYWDAAQKDFVEKKIL